MPTASHVLKPQLGVIAALALFSLNGMNCSPADSSDGAGPTTARQLASRTQELDAFLAERSKLGYAGTVEVSRAGSPALSRGFGLADREANTAAAPQTLWSYGSLTKQFTAVAVLQLASSRVISLDDPIGKHVPDLASDKASITIHQLLAHTSGLPEYSGPDGQPLERSAFLERVNRMTPRFEPGSGFAYSNVGYSLLAAAIEAVSGSDYEGYVKEHILQPAGIENVGYSGVDWKREDHAAGYLRGGERWGVLPEVYGYADPGPSWNLVGNGGFVGTAADYARFHNALFGSDRLLSAESRDLLTSAAERIPGASLPFARKHALQHGYAWIAGTTDTDVPFLMFGGSNDVFSAVVLFYPRPDILVFLTSNSAEHPVDELLPAVHSILMGEGGAKTERPPESESSDRFVGLFSIAGVDSALFMIEAGKDSGLILTPRRPAAFLRLAGDPAAPAVAREVRQYANKLVEASRNGASLDVRFAYYHEPSAERDASAETDEVDAREIHDAHARFWQEFDRDLGPLSGTRYWGAVTISDVLVAQVEVIGERGTRFIVYVIRDGYLRQVNAREDGWRMLLRFRAATPGGATYVEHNTDTHYRFVTEGDVPQIWIGGANALVANRAAPGAEEEAHRSNSVPPDERQRFWETRDPATLTGPHAATATARPHTTKTAKATTDPVFQWTSAGPDNLGGRTRAVGIDKRNSNIVVAGGVSGGIWRSTDQGLSWSLASDPGDEPGITTVVQDPRPGFGDTWYAAGGEAQGQGGFINHNAPRYAAGLFRSTDNGASWSVVPGTRTGDPTANDTSFDLVNRLVVSPTTGSIFLANNSDGVYRSKSDTLDFQLSLGAATAHAFSDISVAQDGSVVAVLSSLSPSGGQSAGGGVFRSTDDGETWADVTPATFPSSHRRSIVAVAPSNPTIAFVLTYVATNGTGVEDFRLHRLDFDAGVASDRTTNLPNFGGVPAKGSRLASFGGYTMLLAIKPDDEDFVVVGGIVPYRSLNGWATSIPTFEQARIGGFECAGSCELDVVYGPLYPEHYSDQHAMAFDPNDTRRVWSAHDGGLSLTNDITATRVAWSYRHNGFTVSQFYSAFISANADDGRIGGGLQDYGSQLMLDQRGAPAEPLQYRDARRLTYDDGTYGHFTDDYVVLGASQGKLRRLRYLDALRTDVESELQYILRTGANLPDISPPGATGFKFFIHPFAVDPVDNTTVFYPDGSTPASGATVWRSADINAPAVLGTWQRLDNLVLPFNWLYTAFGFSVEPAHRLYLGASAVTVGLHPPRIYRFDHATNSTLPPVEISIPNVPAGVYVRSIAVNPDNADECVVVLSNFNIVGLYHTADGGGTWNAIEGSLLGDGGTGPSVRSATILPLASHGDDRVVYLVGTSAGLYSTTRLDGMDTEWLQEASDVMGNVVVDHVTARTSDGRIVAATHGRGLFVGELDKTSVGFAEVPDDQNILAVVGAHPNPFSDRIRVDFSVYEPTRLSIMMYDASGRLVRVVRRSTHHAAGEYHVVIHASTLAGGNYILRFEADISSGSSPAATNRLITLIR